MVSRTRWLVRGVVQGVGYRAWIARHARSLGLNGWIINRSDGSVEAEAAGDRAALRAFEELLRQGPQGAVVRTCDVLADEDTCVVELNDFTIRRR